MPARKSGTTRSTKRKSRASNGTDAYALLKQDHQKVQKLFREFGKMHDDGNDPEEMQALARQICTELKIHTQVEEELFYPALREALEDTDLLDEAQVEHDSAKELIGQIEHMAPDSDMFAACVKVLCEYVNHHIGEEQDEIFPAARKAKVDADDLAHAISNRKLELKGELGADGEGEWDEDMPSRRAPRRSNGPMRTVHR